MLLRSHLSCYPSPSNLSYSWNFGFLALVVLALQMATGIFLAMHYVPHASMAFASIEHILRDVQLGWLLRYAHANGASFFFGVLYLHIFRGLYYASYMAPREATWLLGVLLFFLLILTAFIGYVLPWGQMSLWGATVITNLASAIPLIGPSIVKWLWGGYAVSHATLVRFFSLHYLLPFTVLGVSLVHLQFLHVIGSSNPLGISSNGASVVLVPYFLLKDGFGLVCLLASLAAILGFASELLAHSDNAIEANPLVTPLHIVPEWYFLPFYAILRSIPHKFFGVIAMVSAILLLGFLPWLSSRVIRSPSFLPLSRFLWWSLLACWLLLGWLGGMPVESPYILLGQIASCYYFLHFLFIMPLVEAFEARLLASMSLFNGARL
nr:cytochrome b [Chroothece mobilis]